MRTRLTALFLCFAILLGIAGTASGAINVNGQKTASGDFFEDPNIYTYKLGSLELEPCREDTIVGYDPATGVLFYVRQNPWSKFDPLGLWEINRDSSEETAKAISEDGDSIESLAQKLGYDPAEVANWLPGYDPSTFGDLAEPIGAGHEFTIPNTIIAIKDKPGSTKKGQFESAMDEANILRIQQEQNFKIVEMVAPSDQELYDQLKTRTGNASLHGIYLGAHGYIDKWYFESSKGNKKYYHKMIESMSYKLAKGYLSVCEGGWCRSDNAQFINSNERRTGVASRYRRGNPGASVPDGIHPNYKGGRDLVAPGGDFHGGRFMYVPVLDDGLYPELNHIISDPAFRERINPADFGL